jgi:hypothetical protein
MTDTFDQNMVLPPDSILNDVPLPINIISLDGGLKKLCIKVLQYFLS